MGLNVGQIHEWKKRTIVGKTGRVATLPVALQNQTCCIKATQEINILFYSIVLILSD